MRVLATVHWFAPHHNGGAEIMLLTMLRALVDRGHTVDVLESREPLNESYRHDGYRIDGIRVHPYRGVDQMSALVADSDVTVTHLENTARTVILSRWMQKPCFVIEHNDFDTTWTWAGERDVYHVRNSAWLNDALPAVPGSLIVRPPILADEYKTRPGDKVTLINLNADKGAHVFYALAERMPDT